MDEQNPLIPAGFDIAWSVVAVAVIALTIVALISLARSAQRLTSLQALIWVLVVLFVPVLGSISWMAVGRRTASLVISDQS
ncbi:PLDc N-terminal domain-containing protein [Microbacterium allomyrinae]|uniref:PLDc N-terminal domain-containing protein n=1 Tax=Microbacterium allomyrinae TaxID=2830666 RepID=A0A9X1LVK9_9MICO|nr:PLDc N-terminal domain-containing protein [Microbacterium allomyrinae]MCC2032657.1 PLDc N-terminal domain-containing protein [Microbacterium allomyrinae]